MYGGKFKLDLINKGMSVFMKEYYTLINVGLALTLLTGILAFIYLLVRMAAYSTNDNERAKIIKELGVVGVVTSLVGAFWVIISLYFSILGNG